MELTPIPDILDDLRAGKIIILVDDEDRENEGDFVCAAEKITTELINFMTRVAGGYLCLSLTEDECDRLDLVPQASTNTSVRGTPFTVSVDGHPKHGVGTGISAADRVKTIQLVIDPQSTPADLVRPGHINPLRSRDGGVLVRTGQTEGSVDLARMAGLHPSAMIIEIVNQDGTMARRPDLDILAKQHGMKICSVEQIIEYRLARERLVRRIEPTCGVMLDTPYGRFRLIAYQSPIDPLPHLALVKGDIGTLDANGNPADISNPVLVRMHRRNLLGDIFDDVSNPTGADLRTSMRMIEAEGQGTIVYLRPEVVGDGLHDRLLQIARPSESSIAGAPKEQRDFGTGCQILRDLGIRNLRLLTNHPRDVHGLSGFGLEVTEHVAIVQEDEAARRGP